MNTTARLKKLLAASALAVLAAGLVACNKSEAKVEAGGTPAANPAETTGGEVTVGVISVTSRPMSRNLTLSSELVPFQEIDVYAKESGFVKQLLVDYGTRVKEGQLMAVLEIPELEMQLQQDEAAIKSADDQVTHAEHEINRIEAQNTVLHLEFDRLDKVSKTQPGLVAQQEVDDAQGKDLATAAQVEAAKANLSTMKSLLDAAKAKRDHDQALFNYSKITAPFAGTVTQRYANLGTLMQSGIGSSTQALPLVRLSQDDVYRLVIPVPETYVSYIRIGDPVQVKVPSLNKTYTGKVARFSVDVKESTRTMHTEVDIRNTDGKLIPGAYADATLNLDSRPNATAVPLQAVNQELDQNQVFVVDSSKKIQVRPVTVGFQTANYAEVLGGLQPGDMVIVSDRSALKPNQTVNTKVVDLPKYEGQEDQN
jgi:RND family efflux transporter MFP subunit